MLNVYFVRWNDLIFSPKMSACRQIARKIEYNETRKLIRDIVLASHPTHRPFFAVITCLQDTFDTESSNK
ncbi:hypothetical protein HBH56_104470 [Parastagonospora nodorum]|nr:hypothetical protein HBH56_104470 [Parastagonospora nodorum]KAH3929479.1 hypothetical protein HBH54_125940 [Parastagonospora nodorum]KAH4067678.1 hypothetical protein HBH50_130360 [Parastagonospora nodorum]KAH4086778.1 hypothetical protein HBH48_139780 [Parastagonospora nodorum]KAH4098540.1 hypothetical protein HBH46_158030 [Parastagonospora nodorum]